MAAYVSEQQIRCFLSSPRLVDTARLRQVLGELGVEVSSVDELPTAGELPTAKLLNQMRSASFVLGVLTKDKGDAVLFELGVGIGLGKPVFLIAEHKESLATGLLDLPLVVSSLSAVETLRFHLEAFITNLKLSRGTSISTRRPPRFYGGGEAVPVPLDHPQPRGMVAERRVAEALRRAGGNVTVSPTFGTDAEADMVVWLSGPIDLGAGGPILVEVKSTARGRFPEGGVRQLERLIRRSHLRAAILITNTTEKGVAARMLDGAYLYALSISELERFAESEELVRELTKARNRLAHGVSPS